MKFSAAIAFLVLALAISCDAFFLRYGYGYGYGGGHHDHYDNYNHGGNYHYSGSYHHYKRDTAAALSETKPAAAKEPVKIVPATADIPQNKISARPRTSPIRKAVVHTPPKPIQKVQPPKTLAKPEAAVPVKVSIPAETKTRGAAW